MNKIRLVVLLLAACNSFALSQVVTVNVAETLHENDATYAVYKAIEQCKTTNAKKIIFPKGKYDFRPDYATEKFVFVSNNTEGLKRFAFDLSGMQNIEIDGQGSQFIFHGFICPFLLDGASNIRMKNFSIDYSRTFHSEGKIIAVFQDSVDIQFSKEYPYNVINHQLHFFDGNNMEYPWANLLEFDSIRKETAFMANDFYCGSTPMVNELTPGTIRLYLKGIKGTRGNTFVFGAGHRNISAFTIYGSSDITISDVDIFHCGGMGVVAQLSGNISLKNVRITPSSGRVLSLTADATHFVNCYGKITMENCLFENQNDDATNIHGMYAHIDKIISENEISVSYIYGFDFMKQADSIEFVEPLGYITYGFNKVKGIRRINNQYSIVNFEKKLPIQAKPGDAVATIGIYPDVIIRKCIIRNNRARGILLGSRGKILIEDNLFHTPGTAILLEGDARTGAEQAGVRDLSITNNVFENCNFSVGPWGGAAIEVRNGITPDKRDVSRYNQNIRIENNLFKVYNSRILNMYSVDGLLYRNNKIEKTTAYPAEEKMVKPIIVTHSSNVIVNE